MYKLGDYVKVKKRLYFIAEYVNQIDEYYLVPIDLYSDPIFVNEKELAAIG